MQCVCGRDVQLNKPRVDLNFASKYADVGKQQILCSDLTGDHFLNPEKMTVKQLRKALKDRRLLPPGNNSKKGELQKPLKSWMDANSTSDRNGQTKLHTVEIVNQPTMQATAVVFSE